MCTLTFFFENIDNYDSESCNIKKRNRFHIKVKMKNINIKSIAQEAGVSRTTVSRVLNNSGYVNIETQKKVDQVIKKYGYTPSAFARYLHKGHSDIIGVLIPEIENPFFGEILKVISREAENHSLSMICFNSNNDGNKDIHALVTMKNYRIKGLIYTPAVDYQTEKERQRISNLLNDIAAPVILLDRKMDYYKNADGVFFDNFSAAYQATKALIEAGHTNIAIINAELNRVLARERQAGYLKALAEFSLKTKDDYIFLGDYTVETSYELAKKCLTLKDRPTAVLTCNNFTSLGFMKAANELGIHLKEDIVCVGFDRLNELEIMGIPFNYIERNTQEMADKAVDFLIKRLAAPERPYSQHVIMPKLVLRNM